MGFECVLEFDVLHRETADRVLRNVQGFDAYNPEFELYSFRRTATGSMPDADAKIVGQAIHVCEYLAGSGVVEDIRTALAAVGLDGRHREI